MYKNVVVAIPPSYNTNQELDIASTLSYIEYLQANSATHVMTTAGTSQFNLLSDHEIHLLNESVSKFNGYKILGIPPVSLKHAIEFIRQSRSLGYVDDNTKIMALYPDRFYDYETLYTYIKAISDSVGDSIYVHAQKMRNAVAGDWNYESDLINDMYQDGYLCGIKEEQSSLDNAYSFVSKLDSRMHIIVAGGSMRRYQYLESAGANSLLSGVGNLYPAMECRFIGTEVLATRIKLLEQESIIFSVFMKHGWHKSLREALRQKGLTCHHDRQPWPIGTDNFKNDIKCALDNLENEMMNG